MDKREHVRREGVHRAAPAIGVPPVPLLDAGDLPGVEDWAVIEALRATSEPAWSIDAGDDRFVARTESAGAYG